MKKLTRYGRRKIVERPLLDGVNNMKTLNFLPKWFGDAREKGRCR
jgi:hypothetical protein